MITKDEFDTIIRAYFSLMQSGNDNWWRDVWHSKVVAILRDYPEYANFFLTPEERRGD